MFVPNSSPAHFLKELVDYVDLDRVNLRWHRQALAVRRICETLFLQMADMKMTHVPYRGAAPAFSDLIPGRVDCYFGSGTLLWYSRSGQVRLLASTGPTRNKRTPGMPAIAEYVPGYEVVSSQALFVPAKTPRETVRKMTLIPIQCWPIRRSETSWQKPATWLGVLRPRSWESCLGRKSPDGAHSSSQ